jgi:hypothetical protein
VLGIISNLEMIKAYGHRSYINDTPFYIWDLSVLGFLYPTGEEGRS